MAEDKYVDKEKKQYLRYTKENEGGRNRGPYYDPKIRRWKNSYGLILPLGKGYYSKKANSYVVYHSDGTRAKYTPKEYAEYKNESTIKIRKDLERKYALPFNKKTAMRLTNAGKATGAIVSPNQLDSIAKYSKMADISLVEGMGVSNKESTFSNAATRGVGYFFDHSNDNGTWTPEVLPLQATSPVLLTSNWQYITDNPYMEYLISSERITDELLERERKARNNPNLTKYDIGLNYFLKLEAKFNPYEPPLLNAFLLHKSGKYNSRESNYMNRVLERGRELYPSPEFQQWFTTSEYAY